MSKLRKPPRWALTRGLVTPGWEEFWGNVAVWPMWSNSAKEYSLGRRFLGTDTNNVNTITSRLGLGKDFAGGNTDYIDIADNSYFTPSGDFTLFAYVKPDVLNDGMLITRDNSGSGNRAWGLLEAGNGVSGTLSIDVFKSGDSGTLLNSAADLFTASKFYLFVGTYQFVADGSSILRLYIDGVEVASRSDAVGPTQSTTTKIEIGRREYSGFNNPFNGTMLFAGYSPTLFSPGQIKAWAADPFGPFRMVDEVGAVVGLVGGDTPMLAAQGNYTLTGQAALLTKDTPITAAQGSYSLTGQAANTLYGRLVAAMQGSYTFTGQTANLLWGHLVLATQGDYALTGQATITTKDTPITAVQGAYTLAGQAADTLEGSTLITAQGSYALTGQASDLLWGHLISATQGSYTLTGQSAVLSRQVTIVAAQGSYTLTGQAADFFWARLIGADQGSYALTGQAALTRTGIIIGAGQGSYILTGQTALLFQPSGALGECWVAGAWVEDAWVAGAWCPIIVAAVVGWLIPRIRRRRR